MATNPMQKKSRISFILGMLLMLVIAAVVVAFLYMKIQNQEKEIQQYKNSTSTVYVLNQDVKSGQVLTSSMFITKQIANNNTKKRNNKCCNNTWLLFTINKRWSSYLLLSGNIRKCWGSSMLLYWKRKWQKKTI